MPKWDLRFLAVAKLVASWSKDPSTQCGAVIVRPDKTICATGFNGFPRFMDDGPILYQNREEKYSRIIHAEMNTLLFAREKVEGYVLYTYPLAPCDRCCVHMIQAGIKEFVFPPCYVERWLSAIERTKSFLCNMNLTWKEIDA